MGIIKDILEAAYYVAFIILTCRIVMYAKETFIMQSEKCHKILCKIYINNENQSSSTEYGLELYNYGNDVAKDVKVIVKDTISFKCDFIKPNESILFPLGTVLRNVKGDNIVLFGDKGEKLNREFPFSVELETDGERETREVNTDILFSFMGRGYNAIANSIDRVASEIRNSRR